MENLEQTFRSRGKAFKKADNLTLYKTRNGIFWKKKTTFISCNTYLKYSAYTLIHMSVILNYWQMTLQDIKTVFDSFLY